MSRLFALLLEVCLLRRGPQDLPYSPRLTQGLLLLGIGTHLVALRLLGEDALGGSLVSLLLLLGLPWVLLGLRQRRARYAQTLAAFLGTGLLFTALLVPLGMAGAALPPVVEGVAPSRAQLLVVGLTFVLVGWKIAINGHIWRHALDWPRAVGLPFALLLFFVEVALVRALFPAVPAA